MADWAKHVTEFVTVIGTFLGIFVIDATVTPYLTVVTEPIVIGLNVIGFCVILIGIGIIWYKHRPRLEIKVNERFDENYFQDPQSPEVVTAQHASQSLHIKAKNDSIRNLNAKVKLENDTWEYFLFPNLIREQEADIGFWDSTRRLDLSVATGLIVALKTYKLSNFTKDAVSLEIQFFGENYLDRKPRKFTLTVKSWETINLAQAH